MIVKFVAVGRESDCMLEHIFECDSVEWYAEFGDNRFTMHSKVRGEMVMSFPKVVEIETPGLTAPCLTPLLGNYGTG
jgi:hypothetical protein